MEGRNHMTLQITYALNLSFFAILNSVTAPCVFILVSFQSLHPGLNNVNWSVTKHTSCSGDLSNEDDARTLRVRDERSQRGQRECHCKNMFVYSYL